MNVVLELLDVLVLPLRYTSLPDRLLSVDYGTGCGDATYGHHLDGDGVRDDGVVLGPRLAIRQRLEVIRQLPSTVPDVSVVCQQAGGGKRTFRGRASL